MKQNQKDSWNEAFEHLTFTDDYIFKLVMEDPDLFKAVLSLILPSVEVEKLTSLETEKPMTVDYFLHGVRFDILAKGVKKFIDVEVQVLNTGELPERALYYLSLLVVASLKKGQSYKLLGESYVVFFCKADPFDQGLPVYTFSMKCEENPTLRLTKKARIIFFNAAQWQSCKNEELRAFLRYMMTGEATTQLTRKIDTAVQAIKQNSKVKGGWGMLYEAMVQQYDKGKSEGITIGFDRGSKEARATTARAFLKMGFSAEQVAEGTGLPLDDVKSLL